MSKKIKNLIKYEESFIIKYDTLFNSLWVSKFINKFIKQGKKHLVEKSINLAFLILKFKFKHLIGVSFTKKIAELRPLFMIIKKRLGRKYPNVPIPIKEKRQNILALHAIHKCVNNFKTRTLTTKIVLGLSDVFFGGKKSYITKRSAEQIRVLADARLYLHLRW